MQSNELRNRMTGAQLNRRLAAILAADVVGYSRFMAEDEAGTLASLNSIAKRCSIPLSRNMAAGFSR